MLLFLFGNKCTLSKKVKINLQNLYILIYYHFIRLLFSNMYYLFFRSDMTIIIIHFALQILLLIFWADSMGDSIDSR